MNVSAKRRHSPVRLLVLLTVLAATLGWGVVVYLRNPPPLEIPLHPRPAAQREVGGAVLPHKPSTSPLTTWLEQYDVPHRVAPDDRFMRAFAEFDTATASETSGGRANRRWRGNC